jgi:hypothetical protein
MSLVAGVVWITRSPDSPDGQDPVFSALESALLELLREAPDTRAAAFACRLRFMGAAALLLTAFSMSALALPCIGRLPELKAKLFKMDRLLLTCSVMCAVLGKS